MVLCCACLFSRDGQRQHDNQVLYYFRSWGHTSIYHCVSKGKLRSMKHIIWCEILKPSLGSHGALDPPGPNLAGCHGDETMGSPDQGSLPPPWDPPSPWILSPRDSGASSSPGDTSHHLGHNLKCLLKVGPFLTSWKGLSLSDVGCSCFF